MTLLFFNCELFVNVLEKFNKFAEYLRFIYCKAKTKLKDMTDGKTNEYAFYFICIFCKAVCENVDSKGKTSLTGKPQLYVDGDGITLYYKREKESL